MGCITTILRPHWKNSTEDATLLNPVHVRDMMLRHTLSTDQPLA
jgi:hypothetical protein